MACRYSNAFFDAIVCPFFEESERKEILKEVCGNPASVDKKLELYNKTRRWFSIGIKDVICQTYYLRKNTILHTSNIYIRNQRKPEETVLRK